MSLRVRDPAWGRDGFAWRTGLRRVALILVVGAVSICAGVVAAKSSREAAALSAIVCLCLYMAYATGHPRGAIIVMFASLSLVPVYAVPTYRSFYPEPTAVAALVIAVAFFQAGGRLRFTVVDLAFAATCGAMLMAALLGPHSLFTTVSELFLWVPPYLAGRAICKRRDGTRMFVLAAAVTGLVAIPFIAYETISRTNVFFSLARAGSALTKLWARPAYRPGGLLRSQGAFGHPLSMALIISSCAVFALALALRARERRQRVAWLIAVGGLVAAMYTSHERSGWFVLIGGVLLLAAVAIPSATRIRYAFTIVIVVVPLAFLAVSATHPLNGEASVARTESTADRVHLWEHAFEPGVLGLVGLPETTSFNHFVNAIRPGQTAVDSGFLQVADVYGVIAFIALLVVVAAVIRVAVAVRGTWEAVVPAVALADLLVLTVIGFQTQVPIFIWLAVGAVSGVDLRRRSRDVQILRPNRFGLGRDPAPAGHRVQTES